MNMIKPGKYRPVAAALALAVLSSIAMAQADAPARQQRLDALGAVVESEQRGAHGRSIELRGTRLGTLDTSVDPADKAAVERETRRYLATIEDLVGPVGELQLGRFTLRHEDGDAGVRDSTDVSFRQLIRDIPVASGLLGIVDDKVVRVRTTFVDTDQPGADPANWNSDAEIRSRAEQALRSELSSAAIDVAKLVGPEISLRVVDDDFSLAPLYIYRYGSRSVEVHAITLETATR